MNLARRNKETIPEIEKATLITRIEDGVTSNMLIRMAVGTR